MVQRISTQALIQLHHRQAQVGRKVKPIRERKSLAISKKLRSCIKKRTSPTSRHHGILTATRVSLRDPSSCLPSVFRLEESRGRQLLSAIHKQGSFVKLIATHEVENQMHLSACDIKSQQNEEKRKVDLMQCDRTLPGKIHQLFQQVQHEVEVPQVHKMSNGFLGEPVIVLVNTKG